MRDIQEIVRAGYDRVSTLYRGDEEDESCQPYHEWLDELMPLLPAGAAVLDLGCGCGIPVAQRLAASHPVTGVDISAVQVERARRLVPAGRFICADMTRVDFPAASLAAVVAFYSLIHVPLAEQPPLLERIRGWLRPGGYLLATVGHEAWTGVEADWLGGGVLMAWSHADAGSYRRWLRALDYHLLWERFIAEGDGGHTLVLAQRPSDLIAA